MRLACATRTIIGVVKHWDFKLSDQRSDVPELSSKCLATLKSSYNPIPPIFKVWPIVAALWRMDCD